MSTPRAAPASVALSRPRRALATVVAVVFIDLLGFGIIIPILPFYVRSFGVSDVYIGLLAASYSLAQFVFAPLLGQLSDRRGRRPVLLVSIAGSAVAWTVFGLAGSVAVLFVSRTLAGAAGGNISTAQAYVADITPPERRAGALGLVGASFGLGFVFGPALGGFFASAPVVAAARDLLPAAVPATQFSLPSFAAAALSALNFAFAAAFLPETGGRADAGRRSFVAQFAAALADPDLRGLVVSFFLLSVSLTTLVSTASSADRQGSAFGVTQGAGSLGRTVGPPAMAALYATAADWSPFVVGATLLVPVVAILARVAHTAVAPAGAEGRG